MKDLLDTILMYCLILIFSEHLKDIPDEINHNIVHQNYLAAAKLVVKARENLQGPLMNVDALKEVRSDLEIKQEVQIINYIIAVFICMFYLCTNSCLCKAFV